MPCKIENESKQSEMLNYNATSHIRYNDTPW